VKWFLLGALLAALAMSDGPDVAKEAEAKARLSNLPLQEVLERAQAALLKDLCAKAEVGTLSHQEAAVLRNMLRDNGMIHARPPGGPAQGQVPQADLPSFTDPDYD